MALRWEDKGLGVEHAYLGQTKFFTLLSPVADDGDGDGPVPNYRLVCDLPGRAAGKLVQERFDSTDEAKERAKRFARGWLARYSQWLGDEGTEPTADRREK